MGDSKSHFDTYIYLRRWNNEASDYIQFAINTHQTHQINAVQKTCNWDIIEKRELLLLLLYNMSIQQGRLRKAYGWMYFWHKLPPLKFIIFNQIYKKWKIMIID